jgi:hypothetical protein
MGILALDERCSICWKPITWAPYFYIRQEWGFDGQTYVACSVVCGRRALSARRKRGEATA